MAGRKKLGELDKAKSKASRLYWKHQDTLTPEFADEHYAKEMSFYESEKRMGRPPLKLPTIQSRALAEYGKALEEFRDIESKEGVEPVSDQEIIDFKRSDKAGRKAKDEVLHIKKYIRRIQKQIDDIKAQDASEFKTEHEGRGRPGMSQDEKVKYYEQRIFEAEEEIKALLKDKAEHEIVYYELFELKNDRRSLVVEQKKHEVGSPEYKRFAENIGLLDAQIEPVQAKYDTALELAGVKSVRKAPAERVGVQAGAEVGLTVGKQESASEADEKNEVQELKAEMEEMKKMMLEQAELIKALTAKS